MFTRRIPASRSACAIAGSRVALVVRSVSAMPSTAATRRQMERMLGFTSGSPPVIRTFVIPSPAAARTAVTISSSVSSRSWASLQTPSSGMQYRHRRLQRSVTDSRR